MSIFCFLSPVLANIQFEDVSQQAGITRIGKGWSNAIRNHQAISHSTDFSDNSFVLLYAFYEKIEEIGASPTLKTCLRMLFTSHRGARYDLNGSEAAD